MTEATIQFEAIKAGLKQSKDGYILTMAVHAVKLAGILCRDSDFWEWLHAKEWLMEKNERACTEWLISYLDIESRKELKMNEEARELFLRLKASFDRWRKP